MEPVQAWKEHHQYCQLMHIKVNLIGRKSRMKFYVPPSLSCGGGETSKEKGKKLEEEPRAKGKLGADQDMHIECHGGGDVQRNQDQE